MTTRSGRQYSNPSTVATVTLTNPAPSNQSKSSQMVSLREFQLFDFSNIQGGYMTYPRMQILGYLSFLRKRVPGNSHWTQFCDSFDFHLAGQDHPDVFMRLFASSLVGDAKVWIDGVLKEA
jgi:hypothetical protein